MILPSQEGSQDRRRGQLEGLFDDVDLVPDLGCGQAGQRDGLADDVEGDQAALDPRRRQAGSVDGDTIAEGDRVGEVGDLHEEGRRVRAGMETPSTGVPASAETRPSSRRKSNKSSSVGMSRRF